MAGIIEPKLKLAYDYAEAVKSSLEYTQRRLYNDGTGKFATEINFPFIGQPIKKGKANPIDEIIKKVDDLLVVSLVSVFESLVFNRVDNATGEIKKVVGAGYTLPPFNPFSESFVKGNAEINKLANVNALIDHAIPSVVKEKYKAIIDHRNFCAHGERIGSRSGLTLQEIAQCLDDVYQIV